MKKWAQSLNLFVLSLILLVLSGVGTVTPTYEYYKDFTKIKISWVADAAAATVPNTDFSLCGTIERMVTNPGSTAPTANYDISLTDEDGIKLDGLTLENRHTTNTEQVILNIAGSAGGFQQVTYCGIVTFALSGNSVNSATGTLTIFLR